MPCDRQSVEYICEPRCGQPAFVCQLIQFCYSANSFLGGMSREAHGNESGKRGPVRTHAAGGAQRPVCGREPVRAGRALGEEPDVEELDDFCA